MLRVAIAVHQHDRNSANAGVERRAQRRLDRARIERLHDVPVRADPLVDLDHALVEQRRQLDPAYEQLRPVLVTDAQRIGEAARDDQRRALAGALEQGVRRDGRAHLHRRDRTARNRRIGRETEQVADSLDGGVPVALRVFGQQLVRDERPVGTSCDDVGEGAAAIDPELHDLICALERLRRPRAFKPRRP